jgi:hypothetical protein
MQMRAQPGAPQPAGNTQSFAVDSMRLGLARGGGKPLPTPLQAKMAAAFGADFSAVRVHEGPQPARIGAQAFTTGTDIYFAPGRYRPETREGLQLLGHELAHVLQQRRGRVKAPPGADLAVVQDRMLEMEADRMGQRAAWSPVGSLSERRQEAGVRQAAAIQTKSAGLLIQRAEKAAVKISRGILRSEYPYGGAKTTPHIHQYAGGFHLKLAGGHRLNLVKNGIKYDDNIVDALKYAAEVAETHPMLGPILVALLNMY